mmetsp:Transcript_80797/g.182277  ORF Transcript_80797/g.182277 Transcript_80797/m.182277 type:complete len:200 (-) Transcript_80797:94-693(-)
MPLGPCLDLLGVLEALTWIHRLRTSRTGFLRRHADCATAARGRWTGASPLLGRHWSRTGHAWRPARPAWPRPCGCRPRPRRTGPASCGLQRSCRLWPRRIPAPCSSPPRTSCRSTAGWSSWSGTRAGWLLRPGWRGQRAGARRRGRTAQTASRCRHPSSVLLPLQSRTACQLGPAGPTSSAGPPRGRSSRSPSGPPGKA